MSCCGEKIKKFGNIIKGFTSLFLEEQFDIIELKFAGADERLELCLQCEKNTWLTREMYFEFIKKHWLEVIKKFEDLILLPDLPKEEYGANKFLFCQLCKCHLPAKVRIESEKCPENKWPEAILV